MASNHPTQCILKLRELRVDLNEMKDALSNLCSAFQKREESYF